MKLLSTLLVLFVEDVKAHVGVFLFALFLLFGVISIGRSILGHSGRGEAYGVQRLILRHFLIHLFVINLWRHGGGGNSHCGSLFSGAHILHRRLHLLGCRSLFSHFYGSKKLLNAANNAFAALFYQVI